MRTMLRFFSFASGTNDDDLVLHVVILLGNVALDPNGAALIMDSGILTKLVNLLNGKNIIWSANKPNHT